MFLFALCLIVSFARAGAIPASKLNRQQTEILFLSFSDPDLPDIAALIEEAQTEILEARDTPVHFTLEYLDPSLLSAHLSRQKRALAFLRENHPGKTFDLVITICDQSAVSIEQSWKKLFPDAAFLSSTVAGPNSTSQTLGSDLNGVVRKLNYLPTINLALRQNPGTRHVIVISGSSEMEKFEISTARQQFHSYEPDITFEYWTDRTITGLKSDLSRLSPDSIVLFLNFLADTGGQRFTPARVLRTIAGTTNRPIYGTFSSFVGTGVVGGSVADLRDVGRTLGRQSARILNGEPTNHVPVEIREFQKYMFDWRQLHRWGVSDDQIPPRSVVLYWQSSPWQLYGRRIIGLVAALAIETLLILGLLRNRATRKRAEEILRQKGEELSESERRFRLMADSAPVQMWLSGPDKHCTDFNRGWLEFTGRSIQEELEDGWMRDVQADDLQTFLRSYSSAFDSRQSFSVEFRLRRYDGQFRWMFNHGVPRFLDDGTFAGYIGCCTDITDQKEARVVLSELSGRLIQAQEEERARVARELHDDISQRLALLANGLQELEHAAEENSRGSLEKQTLGLLQLTSEISTDIQQLSHQLHPSKLHYLGLATAVRQLCYEFSRRHNIAAECIVRALPTELDDNVRLSLFRTIQESLRNVAKHSQAHHVKIELTGQSTTVLLRVSDDGVGFDPNCQRTHGLGLLSMRERLRLIGGEFSIRSQPSAGTEVEATVPLDPAARPVLLGSLSV